MKLHLPRYSFTALALFAGLFACDPGVKTTPDSGIEAPPPTFATLKLLSPAPAADVQLGFEAMKVDVEFEVKDFTLKPAGQCDGEPECGYVTAILDGYRCTGKSGAAAAEGHESPLTVDLASCPEVSGPHNLTLQLHHDDGTIARDFEGRVVAVGVDFVAAAPPPIAKLRITEPTDGATVALGTDENKTVLVHFETENLTVTPGPGYCGGKKDCGFLLVNIDGNSCNRPGAPGPINNFSEQSPASALFTHCPSPTGPHTLTLTIWGDNYQTLKAADGTPLTHSIQIVTE